LLHLFISPHLDDIALSCAGYVYRLTQSGEEVVIATVCTADAPSGATLSPAALHEHWQWQLGDRPYEERCFEDDRVAAILGAAYAHMGLLDAIYRYDENGVPLYSDKQFMGGHVHPSDWLNQYPELVSRLSDLVQTLAPARLYGPLAAGGHVDHIITRRAVEQACSAERIAYYEDYPYAQKDPMAIIAALGETVEPDRPVGQRDRNAHCGYWRLLVPVVSRVRKRYGHAGACERIRPQHRRRTILGARVSDLSKQTHRSINDRFAPYSIMPAISRRQRGAGAEPGADCYD